MRRIDIFDSTLRDGAQSEGVSFSPEDKINIAKALDNLGVSYIEGGNPGANPKDMEFFRKMKSAPLKNAVLTAFGSTARKGTSPQEDKNCQAILEADTDAVCIFGKTAPLHVEKILSATLSENLKMIEDTVAYFKGCKKEVIYDAEQFFTAYAEDREYSLECIRAAVRGGADWVCLCDTNGGCFPDEIEEITRVVKSMCDVKIGIHCHNDTGCAVANSVAAVKGGADMVQGTYLGIGERCGNANLSTIIANLQMKLGYDCIPAESLINLTDTARLIAEVTNMRLENSMPYVGRSAFSHKAGMHIDAVIKARESFEHVDPELVGNSRRFLMSEVSGRTSVLRKINKIRPDLTKDSPEVQKICDTVKQLEYNGLLFEAADASFELLVKRILGMDKKFFDIIYFKTITEESAASAGANGTSALIKIAAGGSEKVEAAEGDGPIHAMDNALRKALSGFFPSLNDMRLTDYKVRVLTPQKATAATVRVLIQSADKTDIWTTVGASADVIDASWQALTDAIVYKLMKDEQ